MQDQKRRGRRTEGATGGTAAVRRGRDAPTAAWDALTASTGAQERQALPEVVRGYPGHPHATHSPSDAPQGTTGAQGGRRYLLIWKTHPQPPQKPTQPRRRSEGVTAHPQPGTHRTGHGEAPHRAQRGTVAQRPHLAPIPPRRCRAAPTPPQSRRAGNH